MSELADEHDLGSCGATHGGSSPPFPTTDDNSRNFYTPNIFVEILSFQNHIQIGSIPIEHEGLLLQLNWGRYAFALMPTEIDIKSPNIRGLYFSGDSVWSVGGMASDKIYQMAFPLRDKILDYIDSKS